MKDDAFVEVRDGAELQHARTVHFDGSMLLSGGTLAGEDFYNRGVVEGHGRIEPACVDACVADLDASGHVGFDDLAVLLGSWGECQ